jgi:predicted GIY-YIG superfamily endonuclease
MNILDCFDDNIGNLDITKNYIYVLKLVDDRYYVGRTCNILRRIKEHFTEGGALYTKKYKPLKVIEVEEEKNGEEYFNDINTNLFIIKTCS